MVYCVCVRVGVCVCVRVCVCVCVCVCGQSLTETDMQENKPVCMWILMYNDKPIAGLSLMLLAAVISRKHNRLLLCQVILRAEILIPLFKCLFFQPGSQVTLFCFRTKMEKKTINPPEKHICI